MPAKDAFEAEAKDNAKGEKVKKEKTERNRNEKKEKEEKEDKSERNEKKEKNDKTERNEKKEKKDKAERNEKEGEQEESPGRSWRQLRHMQCAAQYIQGFQTFGGEQEEKTKAFVQHCRLKWHWRVKQQKTMFFNVASFVCSANVIRLILTHGAWLSMRTKTSLAYQDFPLDTITVRLAGKRASIMALHLGWE